MAKRQFERGGWERGARSLTAVIVAENRGGRRPAAATWRGSSLQEGVIILRRQN